MVEVIVLHEDFEKRVRVEAARIHRLRRRITRSNAMRDLDRQIVREAVAQGASRGRAFGTADEFMSRLAARLLELDTLSGEPAKPNVYRMKREVAA
jgi:hypothetical protein